MFYQMVYHINNFFMVYMLIYACMMFGASMIAIHAFDKKLKMKKYMNRFNLLSKNNCMPISILVPAYNEETTVIDCIESLLKLDYPEYEIVIINDGSKDQTEQVLIDHFGLVKVMRPLRKRIAAQEVVSIYEGASAIKITLINKVNGGKADALNMGINAARFPLFISLDADSMLQRDSLGHIIIPFMENKETVAVGGMVKVSNYTILNKGEIVEILNPKKWIVIFQSLEYLRVFLTTRTFFDQFNGNLIISGAFGLFKKEAVVNIGGYDATSLGEDMELIVKLHAYHRRYKLPYKIAYASDAICWTQVPEHYKDLRTQRKRWHMGLMKSIIDYRYILLNLKYGAVGLLSFVYYFVFEMFSSLIDIFGVVIILISFFMQLLSIEYLILFMFIYFTYSTMISITAVLIEVFILPDNLDKRILLKYILFSFMESFGFRQLCSFYKLIAVFNYRKGKHSWGKITRKKQKKAYTARRKEIGM